MYSHAKICRELSGSALPLEIQLREWFARVGEVALAGAESWVATKWLFEQMQAWQNHRLREFLRLYRKKGQN